MLWAARCLVLGKAQLRQEGIVTEPEWLLVWQQVEDLFGIAMEHNDTAHAWSILSGAAEKCLEKDGEAGIPRSSISDAKMKGQREDAQHSLERQTTFQFAKQN